MGCKRCLTVSSLNTRLQTRLSVPVNPGTVQGRLECTESVLLDTGRRYCAGDQYVRGHSDGTCLHAHRPFRLLHSAGRLQQIKNITLDENLGKTYIAFQEIRQRGYSDFESLRIKTIPFYNINTPVLPTK